MSLINAARKEITTKGYKGASSIILVSGKTTDSDTLRISSTQSVPIALTSYIGSYEGNRQEGKAIDTESFTILAERDRDWETKIMLEAPL